VLVSVAVRVGVEVLDGTSVLVGVGAAEVEVAEAAVEVAEAVVAVADGTAVLVFEGTGVEVSVGTVVSVGVGEPACGARPVAVIWCVPAPAVSGTRKETEKVPLL
jgi:hypothetical protein